METYDIETIPLRPAVLENRSEKTRYLPSCSGCIAKEIGVCAGFSANHRAGRHRSVTGNVVSTGQYFPARRPIVHHREMSDIVPFVCTGWAVSAVVVPSGKRRIVSFLLAGEIASVNFIFESCSGRAIEAVSEVYCRKFRRSEFQAALGAHPQGNSILSRLLAGERESSDQTHLDLARRSAESRIARLVLHLSARAQNSAAGRAESFSFPLRQQHIADATGLTTVHVCKIMTRMRMERYISLANRQMRILDRGALQALADQ